MRNLDSPTYVYEAPVEPLTRRRWLVWLIVLGVWILLGCIYATLVYLEMRGQKLDHAALRIYSWGIFTWLIWAVLTPFIVWLGRRFPLDALRWKRSLLAHVPFFLLMASIHSAVAVFIAMKINPFGYADGEAVGFWPRFSSRLQGGFGGDLLVYGGILVNCYAIDYYAKYREREFRASQLEAQLAQAQLDSLRMQLHPHFLFNTLNGIVGLVRDRKNDRAVDMLVGLSDLLRHTLEHSDRQEVQLKEELGFIQLYLNIQQMRFSDRLTIEMDVAPDTTKALVPNLILQPLAENALRHGFGRSVASGVIGIRARAENGSLKLTVYDNGAGLPPSWQLATSKGIGLANTAARLEQLYNDDHQFDIRNRTGGGVEVILEIPFHLAP
jgi:two-component system, LytTR family, sensor kinase